MVQNATNQVKIQTRTRAGQKVMSIVALSNQQRKDHADKFAGFNHTSFTHYNPNIKTVDIDQLYIDRSYQREPNLRRIEYITKNFVKDALIIAIVAERHWKDQKFPNQYFVIEGQQRMMSLVHLGVTRVNVLVVPTTSRSDESMLFNLINNQRTSVTQEYIHRQQVHDGEPKSVELDDVISKAGHSIAPIGGRSTIIAVKQLHRLAREYARTPERFDFLPHPIVSPMGKIVDGHDYFRILRGLLLYNEFDQTATTQGTVNAKLLAGMIYIEDALYKQSEGSKMLDIRKFAEALKNGGLVNIRSVSQTAETTGVANFKQSKADRGYADILFNACKSGPKSKQYKLSDDLLVVYGRKPKPKSTKK